MNKYHGTVKEFLEAGHLLISSDVVIGPDGKVQVVGDVYDFLNNIDHETTTAKATFVVYAACLNKDPEPEYELVNCGFTSVEQPIKELLDGAKLYDADGCHVYLNDTDNSLSICSDDSYISYEIVYRRVPLRTKTATYPMPETKAPENGDEYTFANIDGELIPTIWRGTEFDFMRLKAGNVFLKREHAQAKADAQAVEIE